MAYTSRMHIFFQVLTLGSLAAFSLSIHAATPLETVIRECRERTGFSDATCKTLVKKYMNVERCKEYTGYSDDECARKIKEIKEDPELSGEQTRPDVLTSTPPLSELVVPEPRKVISTLPELREKKERDLLALWERTKAVTDILKSRGVDTAAIENAFPEFETKAEDLLTAYDAYITVYEQTKKDTPDVRQSIRLNAKEKVGQAQRALIDYYRIHILAPIRAIRE